LLVCSKHKKNNKIEKRQANLRVALAIAPIKTGGMAINKHPKAATYDRICARPAVLLDNTRWKYT
jgi:hypothetical protein